MNTEKLREALQKLVFAARTTGGTAGADVELMEACMLAEAVLAQSEQQAPQYTNGHCSEHAKPGVPQPDKALLFEHEDGRYAVNPDTTGDPKWHRLGPVDVFMACANAKELRVDRFEPVVMISEDRGRLTADGAAMEKRADGQWIRFTEPSAQPPAPEQQRSMLSMDRPMTFGGCPFCGSQRCVAGQCQHATPEQGDTHHWPQQGDQSWPPAPEQQAPQIPPVLFDGYAVLQALGKKASTRTSAENVSDVLDAVVRLLRASPVAPEAAKPETERAELIARLRAMAENYKNGHAWDGLDGNTVLRAADLLAADSKAVGEVVYFCDYGHEGWGKIDASVVEPHLSWGMTVEKYYTRPQQQAKPLTPEQVKKFMRDSGYEHAPTLEKCALIQGMRFAERAHGIGDQAL